MTLAWQWIGAAAGLLAVAAAARSQTLPVPTLPEETSTDAPARPGTVQDDAASARIAEAQVETRPARWEYGLGLGLGWDSNIDFLVPDGPEGYVVVPRGSLSRIFRGPSGQLKASASGHSSRYPDQSSFTRYYAALGLDGSYRSSNSTTWRLNANYDYGYSDSSQVLADQGVLLPLVKAQTLSSSLGLSRKLGARTSLDLEGRFYRTGFGQGEGDVPEPVDGQSARGTAALERRLGPRDTVAVEYAVESVLGRQSAPAPQDPGRDHYVTHYASLQWSRLLSPRNGLLLEAGLSYTPEAAAASLERAQNFYGGATYLREFKDSSVMLFVRREVVPVFGLGVSRLETRFGLSATIPIGRAWTIQVAGTHVEPQTPEGVEATFATPDEASLSLGRRLGRSMEISSEARYRRRGATDQFPTVEAFQVGLFVSLLGPPRRGPTATPRR